MVLKGSEPSEIVNLLKSYAIYKQHLKSEDYAITYFNQDEDFQRFNEDECRKAMHFIEGLIVRLFPSNMATLLQLHYINELSIEQCAECMQISRSTAFRLLARSHIAVNNLYQRIKGDNTNGNT